MVMVMVVLLVVVRTMMMPRVRDGPKCAYELLTLGALSFPLKCCNSAFFVSRDNLQIRDRKTPQIRWLAHLLRICSVFALSTEKRQSDSLGRARLYCDNSQVMALVRFYTAGNQGKIEQCRTRTNTSTTPGEGARKILVRGNKSQYRIYGVSQSFVGRSESGSMNKSLKNISLIGKCSVGIYSWHPESSNPIKIVKTSPDW